jgi:phosphatidylserine/phosphatidylglycerophosphate/cardiolipin synthase-like enzyme
VITRDRDVIADLDALFATDWSNAMTGGRRTPERRSPSLLVSPVDARGKLVALVATARRELLVTVENLGDPEITRALVGATQRGVAVRAIVPLCDKNPNPLYNLPAARELARAGASVRVMPPPESAEHPYMHSKMILADGATAYVGSVNFSVNSTTKAREIGIVVANAPAAQLIHDVFEADWSRAIEIPASADGACGRG